MTQHGAITLNVWIEIVVIGLLIGNVFNLLGFIATSWAIPLDLSVQIEYEGLGLWRLCQKDPESSALLCINLAGNSSLPGEDKTGASCFIQTCMTRNWARYEVFWKPHLITAVSSAVMHAQFETQFCLFG